MFFFHIESLASVLKLFLNKAELFFCLFVVIVATFFITKNFINREFDKIVHTKSRFDGLIVLISGMIFSAIISAFGMFVILLIDVALKFNLSVNFIEYYKIITVIAFVMILSYVISAPNYSGLRLIKISDEEATEFHSKILRIAFVSFFIIVLTSMVAIDIATEFNCLCECLFSFVLIAYYFIEILFFRSYIDKALKIHHSKSASLGVKFVSFINDKLSFIAFFCMTMIVIENHYLLHNNSDVVYFKNIHDIFLVLFFIFALQILLSFFINKTTEKLNKISEIFNTSIKTKQNIVWIYNAIIVITYIIFGSLFLKYFGVKFSNYLFDKSIVYLIWTVFIAFLVFKGWEEFVEIIQYKNDVSSNNYRKLSTFLPILSFIFNCLLFVFASLIILSIFDINIVPIIAACSVIGLAAGLAMQDAIKSVFHGMLWLVDGSILIGEFVTIGEVSGIVEKMSMFSLHLRGKSGVLYAISYHLINAVNNYSRNPAIIESDLLICSSENVEKACEILTSIVNGMRLESVYKDVLLKDVVILGVKEFTLEGVKIIWRYTAVPGPDGFNLQYEIFKRIQKAFLLNNIAMPIAGADLKVRISNNED